MTALSSQKSQPTATPRKKSNIYNVFRLAEISIKEGIAEGITRIFGKDVTNPILRTTDDRDFKYVDKYYSHQLFTPIIERAERSEAKNIRRQFVNIARKSFDWKETVVTNAKRMAALAAKYQVYRVWVHSDLQLVVILANIEWAAQQTWGTEISVAYRKIVAKYRYNHSHDADSIHKVLIIFATADVSQDRKKAKAPGELADMVS